MCKTVMTRYIIFKGVETVGIMHLVHLHLVMDVTLTKSNP